MSKHTTVRVSTESLSIPTYLPALPDRNPMFLEKRVYQGSSGRIYPLPFTDRIVEKPVDRTWKAVWIENEFLRVLVLPEIGGRIHRIQDKTNGYDLIYHQRVIKPALVGLAGPWISGGIEFNWPQHHRPATFLPVDWEFERHGDGSKTVWCSDHDPLCRMKGMHGICLHPGRAVVELKVRAWNRTPLAQTFLWWANMATRVHEAYQSFFPPDVCCVADHARRAMSGYPLAKGFYYGVDYGERGRKGIPAHEVPAHFNPPHCGNSRVRSQESHGPGYAPNDLSFYANIPTPCSYMCLGSQEDFCGGYDHTAQAGVVHIANHHISPGKKQWTWGNHDFGYAWDRNLTDKDARGEFGPYIEIMAGVYTDNQPDFSFLQPGEAKTWSQYWYPIRKIGPPGHANLNAAVSLRRCVRGSVPLLQVGVSVTREFPRSRILLSAKGRNILTATRDLAPGSPFTHDVRLPRGVARPELLLRVHGRDGEEVISWQPRPRSRAEVPPPATEPPAPADIASADELFITGLHLEQYRHATRCPTPYWREALRRDPLDARCNNALGLWHLRRGEFETAETHFRHAIERLTRRNPNPSDGEAFYHLGLCLRYRLDMEWSGGWMSCRCAAHGLSRKATQPSNAPALGLFDSAYAAFYKATWNQAWAAAAYLALAEMDCRRADWETALDHLDRSLRFNTDNLRARNLKTLVLRWLNREQEAKVQLTQTLALDPLDWWARHLAGRRLDCDLQTALDVAHDYARAGFVTEAIELLETRASARFDVRTREGRGRATEAALPGQSRGVAPMIQYTLGWMEGMRGCRQRAAKCFKAAAALASDYCFPARLEEIAILEAALRVNPKDATAPYYLGNLLYDRRRHAEAIRFWEKSAGLDPGFSIVWRNLGIGYFNILKKPAAARHAYDRACAASPGDARLLYERDQLWKRLGDRPVRRLRELERRPELVKRRDDLSLELCALYNLTGRHARALEILSTRHFQPWEGGEGGPLEQWVRATLAMGRQAMRRGDAAQARTHFAAALEAPGNLGEARHLLANQSDIHYLLGCALAALGEKQRARDHWSAAAHFKGDFQEMSVRAFSETTYFSALSWDQLGRKAKARKLLRNLLAHARKLRKTEARIDYFATSLPAMLLFEDDLQFRQETTALFLEAQAQLGLGNTSKATALLRTILKCDPNHALAADFQAWEFQRKGES